MCVMWVRMWVRYRLEQARIMIPSNIKLCVISTRFICLATICCSLFSLLFRFLFLSLLARVSFIMSPTATTTITPPADTTTSSQCSDCNGSAIVGSQGKRKKQLGPYLLLDTLSLSDEYSKTKRAVHVHTGKEVWTLLLIPCCTGWKFTCKH